ncbi:uncharacterized protein LOC125662248 [Ostrea edulis]|uniref:uncharacterized protein LOC125662248 n=1 Tax=Ostrea edulis TaxID=37623 RepID=UPI002094E796|nr:uncharacterized protein LOC125662248 [Ostrea edulis]
MLKLALRHLKTMVSVSDLQRELKIVNTKLDVANTRIVRLEGTIKDLSNGIVGNTCAPPPVQAPAFDQVHGEDLNNGVPQEFQIDLETLNHLKAASNNPGHLACLLVKKLFPELFLSGRKSEYNWFGGGVKGKKELENRRKNAIKKYVTFFHPEVKEPMVWRERVVTRINECLRRPKKVRAQQKVVNDGGDDDDDDDVQHISVPLTAIMYAQI